jgi:hypothetical protein
MVAVTDTAPKKQPSEKTIAFKKKNLPLTESSHSNKNCESLKKF